MNSPSVQNKQGNPVRIAFVSMRRVRSAFASAHHYMMSALKRRDVVVDVYSPDTLERLSDRVYASLKHLFNQRADWDELKHGRRFARLIDRHMKRAGDYDIILAPSGSAFIPHLQADLPILYASDATSRLLNQYYPSGRKLSAEALQQHEVNEKSALDRCAAVTYPSDWAGRSAIHDYGVSPEKVHVIPWGGNLDQEPDAKVALAPKHDTACRLLFLNTDWERKGGNVAVQTMHMLREQGMDARLTICGATSPEVASMQHIRATGVLDKHKPHEWNTMWDILASHHFLLFPTRAECYGHVICEASAFGMPTITRNTGGVMGALREGFNGHALPENAEPEDFARIIREVYTDAEHYHQLCRTSREEYELRLNWNAWSRNIIDMIPRLIA